MRLKLLKDKNFLSFFVVVYINCIPLAFFTIKRKSFLSGNRRRQRLRAKMDNRSSLLKVFFYVVTSLYFFKKFGFKKQFGRYVAWDSSITFPLRLWNLQERISVHAYLLKWPSGYLLWFFFVSVKYTRISKAGKKYKMAAQGLITLATYGIWEC